MQIKMGNNLRVDFYGNAKDGVYVELVNYDGITFLSKRMTEEERVFLNEILTRSDNGKAV